MDSEVELRDWWKIYLEDSEQESLVSESPTKDKKIDATFSPSELKKRE